MKTIDNCRAEWPEIEWEDLSHDDTPGTWIAGTCGCGTIVNVKPTNVCVNWHGGLSFHNTLAAAKCAYQEHARRVMQSAGFAYLDDDVSIETDTTEGRR